MRAELHDMTQSTDSWALTVNRARPRGPQRLTYLHSLRECWKDNVRPIQFISTIQKTWGALAVWTLASYGRQRRLNKLIFFLGCYPKTISPYR